jgi:ParB family chromosome partitioning protein
VREAEALGQRGTQKKRAAHPAEKDADTLALERRLSDALGLGVRIEHKESGGRVEIHYRTLLQLDSVCERLQRR